MASIFEHDSISQDGGESDQRLYLKLLIGKYSDPTFDCQGSEVTFLKTVQPALQSDAEAPVKPMVNTPPPDVHAAGVITRDTSTSPLQKSHCEAVQGARCFGRSASLNAFDWVPAGACQMSWRAGIRFIKGHGALISA